MHLSKLIECTTRRNLNGLWVIVMCQRRFLDCNTWSTLVGDADKRGVIQVSGQGTHGNSVLPAQFGCEPKTAPKNSLFFKKLKTSI